MMNRTGLCLLSMTFGLATSLGCGSSGDAEGGEDFGQVGILLTSVPSDGTCVRFTTTAGTRRQALSSTLVPDVSTHPESRGWPFRRSGC